MEVKIEEMRVKEFEMTMSVSHSVLKAIKVPPNIRPIKVTK
jgi:hypothetical protein